MKFLLVISVVAVPLLFMQNCGDFSSMQDETFTEQPTVVTQAEQRVPFQMLSKKQVLKSMVTATGIVEADQELKMTESIFSPVLSENTSLDMYNPPRGMSYANLAGEVCRQLIEQEKVEKEQRLIRYDLSIEDSSEIPDSGIEDTIRALARSFWSRNETDEEREILISAIEDLSSGRSLASEGEEVTKDLITQFLCTAMLASIDAITY